MNMKNELGRAVYKALQRLDIPMNDQAAISKNAFKIEYPENPEHGDFSCNVAMVFAKGLKSAPKVLAEKIVTELEKDLTSDLNFVESISVAGLGFINFKIKDRVFAEKILEIVHGGAEYGWGNSGAQKKVIVEYTDPNIFKVFHIGHLMSNAIGESLSRLIQGSGSHVTRLCYPSDIGLHIAKSIWAMKKHADEIPADDSSSHKKTDFLGKMYVEGTNSYEPDNSGKSAKSEIDELNRVIYEKNSAEVNALYEKGRKWSLEHFESLYATLGTKFDENIYESEMAPQGLQIVKSHIGKVFQESEGAVVFKGEEHALHTRVFISSQGLPTYEAKELGLNVTKFKKYPDTNESIIITANEQNEYFKVVLKSLSMIDNNVASRTKHIGHGMLRFASGKMSSRTGNVVTAEALISDIKNLVMEKISDRDFSATEKDEIAEVVAIGAIKYTILRQAIGSDVIFDSSASISFEGDSGPYLQYAAVRAGAILEKVKIGESKVKNQTKTLPENVSLLEKLITRFPDLVERARNEYAPQRIANYLITLAGAFNSYYASNKIIDDQDPLSSYRINLTQAFLTTMTNGLWLLGIKVPKKM
jgi:arginyl-tRNA synthetase